MTGGEGSRIEKNIELLAKVNVDVVKVGIGNTIDASASKRRNKEWEK